MSNRLTYDGFCDWFYKEVFNVNGTLNRLDFAIIMIVLHFMIAGLSIVLPFLAVIFFFAGVYLMVINGYKRIRDINDARDISSGWKFTIFVCAFIPVVWQILALVLIFTPRKNKVI